MILKGNIRANGQELARHLMNDRHEIDPEATFQPPAIGNESVELAELRGFAADDLSGAFAEIEAIATGTKSTKPIYSLSINPSEPMTREEYATSIDRIESKLGLDDQARAVVFHVKNGREHCHVAWSRIDLEKMQARHMEFDHQKLREVARELVRDFGHEMPKYLGEDRGTDRYIDKFKEATLAERGQEQRSGITPAERKATITEAYRQSDGAAAFRAAIAEHGYILAWGDKTNKKGERTPTLVDQAGEIHGLRQQIEGARIKEIRDHLDLDKLDLPTVQNAKELVAEKARENVPERAQEAVNPYEMQEHAQEALEALKDAQRAELKAMHGQHRETLQELRDTESARIAETKAAIKDAYREDWRDLFKRQREEVQAVKDMTATTSGRVKALLTGRAGDAFDFENRGTLAGAFKFIVGGKAMTDKMEKAHDDERQELGDLQRLAEREEIREIKQETKEHRATARELHEEALTATRETYDDRFKEAYDTLEISRRMIEDEGRDMSKGDIADREDRPQWGFAALRDKKPERAGWGFGLGRDDDDDDERPFKPPTPGANFTP